MTNSHITDPRIRSELADFLLGQRETLNRALKAFRSADQPESVILKWIRDTRYEYNNTYYGARCMASRLERLVH